MTYGLVLGSCIFCTVLTLAVYALLRAAAEADRGSEEAHQRMQNTEGRRSWKRGAIAAHPACSSARRNRCRQYAPVSLKEAICRCFTKVFMQPMPNSIIRRQKPMKMRTALCKPR